MPNRIKEIHLWLTNKNVILLWIILFGLILRLPTLNVPLLDANSWRQTDTASMARNFHENELNILYPQVDWRGASSGNIESEFPIYPFIVAVLYKIFGLHDWIGRLVSLVFFVGSSILLFKLTRKVFDDNTAIWAVLFFMISPLNIQYSRAFMPTSVVVFCSIASIYFFSEWLDKDRWCFYLASLLTITLVVAIKPQSLYLGLPLLYLLIMKYRKAALFQWRVWLFSIIVLLLPLLWFLHVHQLFLETHLTVGIGGGYTKFGGLAYWLNPDFYRTLVFRATNDILTLPGLILAMVGIFLRVEKKNYVVLWWGVAFCVYILIVADGHLRHDYYQMPLVPILCIYAGRGLNYLWGIDLFKDSFLKKRLSAKSALVMLFIFMSVVSIFKSKQYLHYDSDRLAYGKRIEELTKKDSLVIFGGWKRDKRLQVKYAPRDPIDFYFSNRKGWEIDLDNWSPSLIKTLKAQGAKYFATFWPMGLDVKADFAKHIKEEYELLEATERWLIYSLGESLQNDHPAY